MLVNRSTLVAAALTLSAVAAEPYNKRGDNDNNTECSSAIVSAYPALTNIPTPDSSLASFLARQTQFSTYTDACVIPAVTGSMAADYTSWASKLQSWQSEYKDELSSILVACSDVSGFQSQAGGFPGGGFPGEVTGVCDTVTWESASAAGAAGSATATGTAASDEAAASESGNAAPRETGLGLAAAVAAAGLVVVGIL